MKKLIILALVLSSFAVYSQEKVIVTKKPYKVDTIKITVSHPKSHNNQAPVYIRRTKNTQSHYQHVDYRKAPEYRHSDTTKHNYSIRPDLR